MTAIFLFLTASSCYLGTWTRHFQKPPHTTAIKLPWIALFHNFTKMHDDPKVLAASYTAIEGRKKEVCVDEWFIYQALRDLQSKKLNGSLEEASSCWRTSWVAINQRIGRIMIDYRVTHHLRCDQVSIPTTYQLEYRRCPVAFFQHKVLEAHSFWNDRNFPTSGLYVDNIEGEFGTDHQDQGQYDSVAILNG